MYKLLLISKYLRRKLAPLFAALAVTLCTAMVIVVISVMGGFLEMMRSSAHRLTGDVIVRSDLTGFPHYEEMLEGLRKLPEFAAATPLLRSYGLLKVDGRIVTVEVLGIEPQGLDQVSNFKDTLHWTGKDMVDEIDRETMIASQMEPAMRQAIDAQKAALLKGDFRDYAMQWKPPADWQVPSGPHGLAGIIPGIAVSPMSRRDKEGNYHFSQSSVRQKVTLTVLPISRQGDMTTGPEIRDFIVLNEFKSGLYDIDANRVYVPFALLQRMLRMQPDQEQDENGPTGRMISGRATEIMLHAKPDYTLAQARKAADTYVQHFYANHFDLPMVVVETWEERHASFLGAVEKEKGLLTFLFAFISVVAVAMIAVIFYMIVLEKTRDIGVLRAIGGSRAGIMSIFMGYGIAIGMLGAAMGLALSASIVWNLNGIQDVLYKVFGFKMWDPAIYYFDKIPGKLNPTEVTIILIAAMLSGLAGSIVPAFIAGRLNPVEALRYE